MQLLIELLRSAHFRGKARLLSLITPDTGTRSAQIFGARFELDLSEFIQRHIYMGTVEPRETRLVQGYLKPGMTFVDAGANFGYYTALGAMLVGHEGRVIAFEPSAFAFEKLSAMAAKSGLTQVTAIQAGLSDSAGSLKLYLGIGSTNHTPTMVPHGNTSESTVKVVPLDQEAKRLGIERIDLIKIDVEGYEPKVLAGATRLLRERRIGAILCEFNEMWLRMAGSSVEALEALVLQAGMVEVGSHRAGVFENRFFRLS
ncbi:MAG TPA: FkbM family methyltransferase [Bryobacteraceae bacterium]|nr:FkbM family methyltransferase [Bryobacteraceae bacterium]